MRRRESLNAAKSVNINWLISLACAPVTPAAASASRADAIERLLPASAAAAKLLGRVTVEYRLPPTMLSLKPRNAEPPLSAALLSIAAAPISRKRSPGA